MLTLKNVRDITFAVSKYGPALGVLSDIASDEDFDFLDNQEEFFKNKLKSLLQDYLDKKKVDFKPIFDIISRTNDILEAFEIDNEVKLDDLFKKIKKGNLYKFNEKFIVDSLINILLDLYDNDIYNGIKIFTDEVKSCKNCIKEPSVNQDPFVIIYDMKTNDNITYKLCQTCHDKISKKLCDTCDYVIDGPWNAFYINLGTFNVKCGFCFNKIEKPDCNKKENYDKKGFYKLNKHYKSFDEDFDENSDEDHVCHICEKNLACESCSNKLCNQCIHKIGCCPGTHISYCSDCLEEDLDLGPDMFGFICDTCNLVIRTCCDNYGLKETCRSCLIEKKLAKEKI